MENDEIEDALLSARFICESLIKGSPMEGDAEMALPKIVKALELRETEVSEPSSWHSIAAQFDELDASLATITASVEASSEMLKKLPLGKARSAEEVPDG